MSTGSDYAANKVKVPALVLMIFSGIGLGLSLISVLTSAMGMNAGPDAPQVPIYAMLPSILIYGFVFYGAMQMKSLKSYGLAMAAAAIAAIPCFCCTCPFGIWSIIVLRDPQVKAAFT